MRVVGRPDDGPTGDDTVKGPMEPRARNDPGQYDDLVDEWWKPDGKFAALHWLAPARARLIPQPSGPGAVLVDVGCGGGLLAPHVDGYRHIGVDIVESALVLAARHGVLPVQGDAHALPLADGVADVVAAGEILEHVPDLEKVVAEIARVIRPGGAVIIDTINDTWLARFALVTVGERVPGGPPPGIHDPALFVRPERLQRLFARHGVRLAVRGIRPSALDLVAFLFNRGRRVRMVPTRSVRLVYQGVGEKRGGVPQAGG
jgi:2-polyprenyl-6-hydroxyphenyl methylase/3-demethylubiquinone-9 3-methyltransferase